MNSLDKQYQALLQEILDKGVKKEDRTGTGTLSLFGRQIRHKMSEGFPLLTTKKMYFKGIVTELLWFLHGDTNIKFLVDNDCHIWNGDAFKKYVTTYKGNFPMDMEEFIEAIKTNKEFSETWGELGPIYGKQWRSWTYQTNEWYDGKNHYDEESKTIDQIANLIRDLKTTPCHYGFQVYTRELSELERMEIGKSQGMWKEFQFGNIHQPCDEKNIPRRAISLMWNQRSVDTFLGLPFNIASYGLLLEIIAKAVNMVPDELIGNLGDVHLYSNHIEQAKEQIGRDLTCDERIELASKDTQFDPFDFGIGLNASDESIHKVCDLYKVSKRTREPYPLPTLNINTEWWPTESGESGVGPIDATAVFANFNDDNFCKCLLEEDLQLSNYQAHPHIKASLSN